MLIVLLLWLIINISVSAALRKYHERLANMLVAFVQQCFVGDEIDIFGLSTMFTRRHNLLAHDDVADTLVSKWCDIGLVVSRQVVNNLLS